MNEEIISPFNDLPKVTRETLEKVKEMTGAKCVFIAISDEIVDHECMPGKCNGHYVHMDRNGFTDPQLFGILQMMAHDAGLKLVDEDYNDE